MSTVCYSADVLCPMTGPPVPDGGILVEGGEIVEVGAGSTMRGRSDRHHRVDGVLLPGLVDARTRLECADVPTDPSGPYHRWRDAAALATREWDDARVGRSAQRGVHRLLRAGTTCVGDVVLRGPGVPAASRAGLAGDSWVEIDRVDVSSQDEVVGALARTLRLPAPGRRVGLTIPGTQAVGTGVLQALAALAGDEDAPFQAVVAASREEANAVATAKGPLAREARVAGMEYEWLEGGTGLSPVAYADRCGLLRPGWSVAHATKIRRGEFATLADRGATAVVNPCAASIVGRPRLAEIAAAAIPVALATEASGGAPDVLAEAAAWVRHASQQGLDRWPGAGSGSGLEEAAVRLATVDGAAAMGWGSIAGILAPGRRADFVGVGLDTRAETVYADLVGAGAGRQVLTVLGGVRRARRDEPDVGWPEHELREEDAP